MWNIASPSFKTPSNFKTGRKTNRQTDRQTDRERREHMDGMASSPCECCEQYLDMIQQTLDVAGDRIIHK